MSSVKTLATILIGCVCMTSALLPAYGSVNVTSTTVVPSSSSVSAGTAVTLTATVTGTNNPVTIGQVLFCNATAAHCDGAAVLGAGQVGADHTASVKLVLGAGAHQIDAVYVGALFPGGASSTSAAVTVTVNPAANYGSSTTIAASGSVGDYSLTGTVTAFGRATPTGTVSFLDTSNGNAVVGSAALNPATLATVFVPSSDSPITSEPEVQFAVSGDFNNDGIPDLAILNSGDPGSVDVFLGIGDGTFHMPAASSTTVAVFPQAMAVADVDGDGKLDLVVVNQCADDSCNNGSVSVLLGNGDGTFQTPVAFATGAFSRFVAVGDLNFDGLPDLAVTNSSDGTVSVLLSTGDASLYGAATSYGVGSGSSSGPTGVAMGIFREFFFMDLAVSNIADGTITILPGNGYGTFNVAGETTLNLPRGAAPYWLVTGDLRDNGTLDLVAPDAGSSSVYVLLGNNDGTFQPYTSYGVGNGPSGVSLGDVNGDGVLDLVVPNTDADGTVSVLQGQGDGTFATQTVYTVGDNPSWAALADFNGDGMLDIATSNLYFGSNSATILLQAQTETATATGVNPSGAGIHNVLASYPGDAARAASESGTTPLTGTAPAATSSALAAAPNPALAGQTVTLTATITPAPSCPLPTTTGLPGRKELPSEGPRRSVSLEARPLPGSECSRGSVSFYYGETLLGTGSVNSSGVATATTTALPVGSDGLTAVYSGNRSYSGSTSGAYTEVISEMMSSLTETTTTLSGSPNPATAGASVTLLATVSPAPTGTPLGTISFYDGEILLATVSVNSAGVATFTSTLLPVGGLSLTAVYSGNASFAGSNSSAFTETVNTAYTVTAPPAPVTVPQGGSVAINVTVPPVGGAYNSVVTLSATGLPPGATAAFNPPKVTPGTNGAPTVMTIQLAPLAAALFGPRPSLGRLSFAVLLMVGFCGMGLGRKRSPSRRAKAVLGCAVLLCMGLTLVGCGGGFLSPATTPPNTYVVTITGTSGALHASTTVTVVVQ